MAPQSSHSEPMTTKSIRFDGIDLWLSTAKRSASRMEFKNIRCTIKGYTTRIQADVFCTTDLAENVNTLFYGDALTPISLTEIFVGVSDQMHASRRL